jgi:hypothetical protein
MLRVVAVVRNSWPLKKVLMIILLSLHVEVVLESRRTHVELLVQVL